MTTNHQQLVFSKQAYLAIVAESSAHESTETGGILLGRESAGRWFVIESIDPGYNRIIRSAAYFEYDDEYVTHLSNVRSRLYEDQLELLGLWHRHPGSFDRFSTTDDSTNRTFAELSPKRGAISSIVNFDPTFRLTSYHVSHSDGGRVTYRKFKSVLIGDHHFPRNYLRLRDEEHFEKGNRDSFPSTSRALTHNDPDHPGSELSRANDGNHLAPTSQRKPGILSRLLSSLFTSPGTGPEEHTRTGGHELLKLDTDDTLTILEQEMRDYLEIQDYYDCNVALLTDGIFLRLQEPSGQSCNPDETIEIRLFSDKNGGRWCEHEGETLEYFEGIVRSIAESRTTMPSQPTYRIQSPHDRRCAEILGFESRDLTLSSLQEVRKQRLSEYHPDLWEADEEPSVRESAEQRTQEINSAFDHFRSLLKEVEENNR